MLLYFSVGGFCSFKDTQDLFLTAYSGTRLKNTKYEKNFYIDKNNRVMKSAVVFGANASGKTNFIKSISFAKECILNGISQTNTLEKNYKLDINSLEKPTQFEFEILIGNKIYAYGFSMMLVTKKVLEEWLVEVGEKEDINIFSRTENKVIKNLDLTENDKIKLDVYLADLESNSLLLEVLNKKKWEKNNYEFLKILKWFTENLIIIFPNTAN